MAFSKLSLLEKAITITTAYASGNVSTPVEQVLHDVYEELKKINQDCEQ